MELTEVRFPTWTPLMPKDMARPKVRERTNDGIGKLILPDEPAKPHPAVVITEGLGELKPARELRYGSRVRSGIPR